MVKRYENGVMTQREVLKLLKSGAYTVDLEAGTVNGRNGKPLKTYRNNDDGDEGKYFFVALYDAGTGKRKDIAVHRLVWMVGNNRTIPRDFEIHHHNGDTEDNAFNNLFALSPIDHSKLHGRGLIATEEDVPF